MADPISSLRTNRGAPTLFDQLSTAGQISQEDQYAVNPENQFSKGLRTGAAGLTAGEFASEALRKEVAGDAGFTDPRDRALQTVRDTRMYAPRVSSLRDVNSIGDVADLTAGVFGQGVMSMAPTIAAAALTRGRGLAGKATAFGGAMVPAYEMERGEAALNQYQDPEQMKASAQERDLAATAKGGINAALESIVPAGLGGSLLRKPAGSLLSHVGREYAKESATEGAQQLVGYGAQKYIDPNKELDPWDIADAAFAGGITGGGMSAAIRGPAHAAQAILDKAPKPQMPEIKNPFQRGDAAPDEGPVDLPPDDGGPGPADTMLGKVAGLGAAVQDRFGDDIAAAGGKAKDMAGKAKDIVSDTLDRMTEAVNTAGNPGEFLNKVFGGNIDEEASADMSGQPNPALKGATFEETEANIARDDEQRVVRAARYADELLNDPATPDAVKERVAAMGGDYTNPDNQSFVARTLVAQRGGEKVAKAVQDLVDLGKSAFAKGSEAASSGLDSAKKAVGDAATAAQDRIVKKNLQSATPAEQAAFGKVVFDGLTDEAKANPAVRAQLSQVTNAIMAFAAKTGDITAKDLPTLTKLANAMSLFKDPDAMAQTLVEYAGLPRTEDSFLSRIKRITNAQQDLKQPNSFLVSSLTPEAKSQLTAPQLQRIAQLVDQFTLIDSADSKKGTALVQGLANAFGSPESAKAVLDYYAQQNKADLRFDPNEGEDARPRSSDDIGDADDIEGFGTLSEQDAKELVPRFRSPNINRPFFRGRDDAASAVELSRGGDLAQRVSMAEHVRASGDSAKIVAGDIRRDLMKRLNDNVSRDTESVREALRAIEAHLEDAPSNGEWVGYSEAVALRNKLRGTKTEDRSAIVKALRDELKALDSAAEKAKRSGKDADEAMLDLYDVVLSSPDSSKASDAQMTKFRKLLDTTSEKKSKAENDAIRKTGVTFKIDGKKVAVSLESMVYNSPVRGSVRERLLESLGLVAARADEMPNIPNDAIVKRNYFGDGRHLTWGRLMGMGANPDVKSKARKQFETDPAKEAIKADLDKVNASSLREYMNSLPKDVDALSTGAALLGRLEGQIKAAKEQMDESPSKVVGDRIRTLSSKRRVLTSYLNEILDADYPVSREAIMDNLESELQAGGIVNKEGQKTEYANILFKEELIQTYRDRADAVKGTSLADDALAKADELAVELDKDLAKLQDFQRMDLMDRPSGREPAGKRNGSTSNTRARLKRVEESLAATDGRVKDRDALEQLRDDLKDEVEEATPKAKSKPNPAASSRETAKKVDDAQALSPDAITALHDVAVKENWSRLDTPAKVLRFAAMAAKAREQLKKIPELERTDEQDDLRFKLNDMFDQSKDYAFDWESLWDGLDPTDAQKAQLEGLIRPKAESGTARQTVGDRIVKNNRQMGESFLTKLRNGELHGDFSAGVALFLDAEEFDFKGIKSNYVMFGQKDGDKSVYVLPAGALHAMQGVDKMSIEEFDQALEGLALYSATVYGDGEVFVGTPRHDGAGARELLNRGAAEVSGQKWVNTGEPILKIVGGVGVRTNRELFERAAGFAKFVDGTSDVFWSRETSGAASAGRVRTKNIEGSSKGTAETLRRSTMKPKRGRPDKIDQQAILDEIARIRGKGVKVAFAKFADIGASGEFSMNRDKTNRLIKIAINSLNPMSVAWHESLHDFMAMLGGSQAERKLKADLLDAAEAPQVMTKLRELLKDHPDALKQIETDREERLAYMYQFWAEGALPLGQTGTNIFSRMVTFFREMLGVLSQDQKIDQLFTALHTGKFSEPSLVGAVLEDLKAQTLGDKARAVAGPIGDAAEAMFTGATDRLRNTNVDALTELADLFHREPGRENPAMTQTSSGAKNSFVSNVDSIGRRAAERRLDAGESQESVFKDTGWFKSADGTMVKEVDDSKVFRRVWDTVHKAISTPENMLKLLDAVLDGKDAETLTTTTLADLLRDLGLTEFAKKVGDIEVRFTTGQSNHVVSARRTGVKQVEIGLGYSAMQSGQDVSSIKDRAVRIANSAALTAIHELQHVLQTLDKRTMNDEGPYEQKESEIEAFDTEVRYVQRILNQMLGDDSNLGLPAIARLVAEADMSAGEIAEAFTSPMFTKAGKHKTERTASTKRTTNELPFLQRRAQQVGKRLNKLQDILKDTTSEERRRALENMQAMKPASTPLEKELAAYLKEMRDYMVDRGVKRFDTKTKKWTDLGNVKDYFPRVWDKEAIRNNEAEFINLMEQYIGKAQARETFNALVNGDGSLELAENEHSLGFTPWNPSVMDRQFTFINPSNAAAFAKFQSKDMADIMTSYTQRAVHRAEYASTFGNDGEVITSKLLEAQKQGATQDELAMARKATMAMEGTLGYDFNPRLKEVMSGIMTYQNIVLLPLSLFSNLIDPLGVAMRSNDMKEAWKAFTYGIKGIADQIRGADPDEATELAKTLGIIDEQNMLEAMGHVYNSMHMSRFLKNINSKFFRYNGMEMWNQRMRVAAMMAAQRFIASHAEKVTSGISHGENKNDSSSYKNHSQRYLEELGITDSDVFQLADGTIALTKDQLLQAGAKKSEVSDIEKRIQAAVFKWVDGAVLRPNAAHRPVWGSDPRYQLIFHLKQFTFSFHNTILRRVGEELKHGNVAPGWILMSYVPFMFLSDVLKGSLTGTLNTTADLYDVASQSIARSGIMGTGVFGADAMGDLERGKLPGTSFLGPAFGHLMTLLSGITGHAGVDQVMNRSVPFAKYI